VERRIAEFWKRVDAMQPGDSLSSTDLGQWALNVIERDTTARITVADFRTSTAGMQAAMDRARPAPSSSPVRSSPAPSASPAPAPLTTPSATVAPTAPPALWRPAIGATWQWQLTGLPVDLSVEVDVYDIDAFETEASTVAALHARGRKVICYVNAGGWEDWRPDAADFPRSVIGAPLDGWPGERWLDVRQLDVLAPLMEARLDLCREKGFDAVEPDNIDGYLNATGFALSYDDQLRYNVWLAEAAHQRGLSIGLKNDMDQIAGLLPHFDWALNEQCFEYDECETLLPFISAGKAVFHVEYELSTAEFCARASELRFSSMRKGLDLDARREPCD
ncbi:MAG: endo alpha-1,4 polygalactosaminidase, partial [Candidatus Limnocylindria bacterium]